MSDRTPERLYALLPPALRQYDPDLGYPLRALMALAESQLELLEGDVARLYDDWFIETCALDIVPHIASLVGLEQEVLSQVLLPEHHAWVGNAIAYRRRKGVVSVLQPVIRAASGWYAQAIELPPSLRGVPDVRRVPAPGSVQLPLLRVDGTGTAVDIRVWRLMPFPVPAATPGVVGEGRFTFHPLGLDLQLFNQPLVPPPRTSEAREWQLPVPLTRARLEADLRQYYGPGKSFALIVDREVVPAARIRVVNLGRWQAPSGRRDDVFVDPELGRILFPYGCPPEALLVSYSFAFSAELGGGTYERRARLAPVDGPKLWFRQIRGSDPPDAVTAALEEWQTGCGLQERGVIEITDNRTYPVTPPPSLDLADRALTIRAANQARPALVFDRPLLAHASTRDGRASSPGTLSLNGLLMQGTVSVRAETAFVLNVDDCTLVPPYATVYAFQQTGTLRWRRYAHTATPMPDGVHVLIAGGIAGNRDMPLNTVEIYDSRSGEYHPICPMNAARARHAALLWQRRSYVIGGRGRDGDALGSIECYDDSGSFNLLRCRLNYPRWFHTVTLLPYGHVLIAGGRDENGPVPYTEIFDPIHERVWIGAPIRYPRYGHAAAVVPGRSEILFYGGAGDDGAPVAHPEIYEFHAQTTHALPPPFDAPAVYRPIAEAMPQVGEILIAGGRTAEGAPTRTALRFVPAYGHCDGTFQPAGPMHVARWAHTATTLADRRVAMVGGEGVARCVAQAELYDPRTRQFERSASLLVARRDHTAVRLANGRLLVSGGRDDENCPLSESELLLQEQSCFGDRNVIETTGGTETSGRVTLNVRRSIVGPMHFGARTALQVEDSIFEPFGRRRGGSHSISRDASAIVEATLAQCTIFGTVDVTSFPVASNVLFMARTRVADPAATCARYSWVPLGAANWRWYRCQPLMRLGEIAAQRGVPPDELPHWLIREIRRRLTPQFTSRHLGDAAFAQLALNCDPAISEGGSSGAEIGVFHLLFQPQRRALLGNAVADYLPFGGTRTITYES